MTRRTAAAAVIGGLAITATVVVIAQAQAKRTLLNAIDVAGTTRQANLGTAEIPAGGKAPRHTHPGEELGMVTEGQVRLKVDGRPDLVVNAGESFAIPRGLVHEVDAIGDGKARVTSVWIIEKGQPLASPAP
jgi:quercetin dioxygenase-like cupin family protein